MPKKTRKAKIRASQRAIPSGAYAPAPTTTGPSDEEFTTATSAASVRTAPAMSRATAPASARAVSPVSVDYSYVFRDLRRIAILAAVFFALMFVLYFIVEYLHIPIIPGIL
ncbi:MAG: hypothetical protein WCF84_26520 [Anaerolineae bacterium]